MEQKKKPCTFLVGMQISTGITEHNIEVPKTIKTKIMILLSNSTTGYTSKGHIY